MPSIWFRISFAEKALLRLLDARGERLETLSVETAVASMIAFYAQRRAQHVDVEGDGDGLLVEWAPEADGWVLRLVRQLQRAGDADNPIHQLALTVRLAGPAPAAGSHWFFDPADEMAILDEVCSWQVYRAATLADIVHTRIDLDTV